MRQVYVVFIDFKKAFDTMDLLLSELGTLGTLVIRCYPTSHTDFNSWLCTAHSGIPQGSHVSHLIFILFINALLYIFPVSKLFYLPMLHENHYKISFPRTAFLFCSLISILSVNMYHLLDILSNSTNVNCQRQLLDVVYLFSIRLYSIDAAS